MVYIPPSSSPASHNHNLDQPQPNLFLTNNHYPIHKSLGPIMAVVSPACNPVLVLEPITAAVSLADTTLMALIPSNSGKEPLTTANTARDPKSITQERRFLVASPYTAPEHLLDLETLNEEYQLMARALTKMRPTTDSYATTAYPDAFNWAGVLQELLRLANGEGYSYPETSFYIIVFRSRVAGSTDREHLGTLDEVAHREATNSGGLLKYWFGTPDASRRNLATCVWRERKDAKLGGAGKVCFIGHTPHCAARLCF